MAQRRFVQWHAHSRGENERNDGVNFTRKRYAFIALAVIAAFMVVHFRFTARMLEKLEWRDVILLAKYAKKDVYVDAW